MPSSAAPRGRWRCRVSPRRRGRRAPIPARPRSAVPRSLGPGLRAGARSARRLSFSRRRERAFDSGVELGGVLDRSCDSIADVSGRVDEVRLREAGDPVAADGRSLPVVDVRVGDAVALEEVPGVAAEVLDVDADEDYVLPLPALPALLQQRSLVLARPAPGGPEVEHDGPAAQGFEREVTLAVETLEREG